mgnify:CR=1 FL=1
MSENTLYLSQDYSRVQSPDMFISDSVVVADNLIISPFVMAPSLFWLSLNCSDSFFSPEQNVYKTDTLMVSPILREKGLEYCFCTLFRFSCDQLKSIQKKKVVTRWVVTISITLLCTTSFLLLRNIGH